MRRRILGWMMVSALTMVISITTSVVLTSSKDWWYIALSKLSLEPYGIVFSLGFWVSALCLAMALHLQFMRLGAVWKDARWRLHGLRWLCFGICAGLGIIGLFPDGGQWISVHRFGAWLCVVCAGILSLGIHLWTPSYDAVFHRFSWLIGALPYFMALAYALGWIRFTVLELFLLFLGAVWMTVFYVYTMIATGTADKSLLDA